MVKSKLIFNFYNPNTAETSAEYIIRIVAEIGAKKVVDMIQKDTDTESNTLQD